MHDRWKQRLCAGLLLVLGLLLVAAPAPSKSKDEAADAPRASLAGSDLEPLRMHPPMAKFLAKQVKIRLDRQARVNNLVDSIFNRRGLGITYGNQRTKTAIETFDSGSGNCLSFTLLFVAMARHVGLAAYFQEVDEVISWDRRGEVVLTQRHMFAEVEFDNGDVQVDFLPGAEKRYRKVRRIGDQRAFAHFYNNIGVEALAEGRPDDALAWIRRALDHDPKFGPAWSNLGVLQRRIGDPASAEQSYLKALEVDISEVALNNLSSLYVEQGRKAEAAPLLERSKGYLQRNPYYHFRLGVQAQRRGDLDAAAKHLRQAIRRHEAEGEFHASLAEVFDAQGKFGKAVESYKKALRRTQEPAAEATWQQRLDALQEKTEAAANRQDPSTR